jgi:UDP-N-acetylmuramyl pentapeptide synthase
LIIDDVYNASPKATQDAITTLYELSTLCKRIPVLVFGQMNELGDLEAIEHQKIKDLINKLKIKHVITRGPATRGLGIYCQTNQQVLLEMQPFLNDNYLILMKSSRGWKMEEVINDIFTKRL